MSTVWTVLRHFMQMPCDQPCLVRFVSNLRKSTQIIIGEGGLTLVRSHFFLWSSSSPAPVSLKTQLWGSCDWLHPPARLALRWNANIGLAKEKIQFRKRHAPNPDYNSRIRPLLGPSSGSQKPPELPGDNIQKWSLLSPLSAGIRELTDK